MPVESQALQHAADTWGSLSRIAVPDTGKLNSRIMGAEKSNDIQTLTTRGI